MGNQVQPFKTSQPQYEAVVGKFCVPKPFAPGGTVVTTTSLPRPMIVGTDVLITASSGDFVLTLQGGLTFFLDWGVNVGDKINFETPTKAGLYTVKEVTSSSVIKVTGPGTASIASGTVWFDGEKYYQKVTGTGTKFKNIASPGDWIVSMSQTSPTVQAAKIMSVASDTELKVERGFLDTLTGPFMITRGFLRGVSLNCGGAGYVNGVAVATDDILTFYQDSGLDPVYGDSGSNTFKILIQQ